MCLVISLICFATAFVFFDSGDTNIALVNLAIGTFFFLLMLRNILKTVKQRKERKD